MSDSLLKQSLDKRGLRRKDLRNVEGLPYSYAVKHYNGDVQISAKYAVLYENLFGIPRGELRPDLWSEPVNKEAIAETISALLKPTTPPVTA